MFSFGASQQQPAQQSGFGGFGSSMTSATNGSSSFKPGLSLGPTAAPATGLFGAPAPASSLGAFGSGQQTASSAMSGSLFGAQPSVPAVSATPAMTPLTKYNDLPAEVQQKLDQFNKTVNDHLHAGDSLDVSFTADTINQVGKEITAMVDKYVSVLNMLNRDAHLINSLKSQTNKEVDNVEVGARLFESMVKHGGPGSVGIAERPFYHPQDYIFKYFTELVDSLTVKLNQYQNSLDDVERMLTGIFGTGKSVSAMRSPTAIVDVIKNNYSTFMSMTSRVAYLHEEVEKECDRYLKWRRTVHNDERNPFTDVQHSIAAKHTQQAPADKFKTASNLSDIAKRITSATPAVGQPQTTAATGLFGQSTARSSTTGGGLFGQPSAPTTGGLFGASTNSQPAQSGLFGSSAGASAGGLFGSAPTTTPAPATGGGLFGSAPSSGGMFGSAQTPTPGTSGGLFGAGSNTPAPPPAPTGGLFGQQQQQVAAPSLFGQPQQPSTGGMFSFGKR